MRTPMRRLAFASLVLLGCSSDGTMMNQPNDSGVITLPDGNMVQPDGGSPGMDASMQQDGSTINWNAGQPGTCTMGIPQAGKPADVSKPTAIVGTGSPASCTFAALQTAVKAGGIITFNCGPNPLTIPITATLDVPVNKNTVIDGGRLITLDGQHQVQIMRWYSANFRAVDFQLTLQHIALVNGKTTPTKAIPQAPPPCSQGYNDGEGGAIYMRDGNLVIIDSIFTGNQGAQLGPDTGGGAIYIVGSKRGILVVSSTFSNNSASNGGGIGSLHAELDVYDSIVDGNTATGHDANNDDATKCSYINNGQHEIGSGGNGGGLYNDGVGSNVLLCGTKVTNNAAGMNAFGGGVFFTSNDFSGTLSFIDSTITGNTGKYWTVSKGGMMNAGTAVGTNCKSLSIVNSKVQGVN